MLKSIKRISSQPRGIYLAKYYCGGGEEGNTMKWKGGHFLRGEKIKVQEEKGKNCMKNASSWFIN